MRDSRKNKFVTFRNNVTTNRFEQELIKNVIESRQLGKFGYIMREESITNEVFMKVNFTILSFDPGNRRAEKFTLTYDLDYLYLLALTTFTFWP